MKYHKILKAFSFLLFSVGQAGVGQINVNWPVGIKSDSLGYVQSGVLNFTSIPPAFETKDLKMNFESTVAAVSDSAGVLRFYTNGCFIANQQGDSILDSHGLNPGLVHDWVCPQAGYICPQGATFLPQPLNPSIFYLLHLGMRYDTEKRLTYGPLYYSVLDMSQDSGKGAVISKNNILVDGELEPFATVRHGNGRDWWVVVPEHRTNIYHRFCLTPLGIIPIIAVAVGTKGYCEKIGSSTFSPDGSRYARTQNCLTLIFDFDRCNGSFSNEIKFERPVYLFGGGGVAFNATAEKLFLSEQLVIYQADLTVPVPVLDTLIPIDSIAGTSLQHMQYGPDGKIYFNLTHRAGYFPTLSDIENTPLFHRKGMILPVKNIRSLPNMPNYTLIDLEGSLCDSLVNVSEVVKKSQIEVRAWPNPVIDVLELKITKGSMDMKNFTLDIFTMLGQKISKIPFMPGDNSFSVEASQLDMGLYIWQITADQGLSFSGLFLKSE